MPTRSLSPSLSPFRSLAPKLFDLLVIESWWVILFLALCYIGYEEAMHLRTQDYKALELRLTELKHEEIAALEIQEDLTLQVGSQSDHAWIEMALMEGLGLVPEDQIKVYFTTSPPQ